MSRSAAAYQKFTEDEIRKANSVDILSLARGYGYEPEKAGRKAVHMKHSGGLYIFPENNRFFQWTGPDDGVKGGAIDFVMREENLSFPEAVGKLIGKEFSPSVRQVIPYEKKEREPLVLPEKADNMKRAYWYLVSVRGISPKIVSHFMNRKMVYQEKSMATACLWATMLKEQPGTVLCGRPEKTVPSKWMLPAQIRATLFSRGPNRSADCHRGTHRPDEPCFYCC